jgi:predicted metal-dependent hydrolase
LDIAPAQTGVMNDVDAEILIEMNRVGAAMEVRAVSAGDGLEVVFTAPANAGQTDIERVARSKLAYVRGKQRDGEKPERKGGKGGVVA